MGKKRTWEVHRLQLWKTLLERCKANWRKNGVLRFWSVKSFDVLVALFLATCTCFSLILQLCFCSGCHYFKISSVILWQYFTEYVPFLENWSGFECQFNYFQWPNFCETGGVFTLLVTDVFDILACCNVQGKIFDVWGIFDVVLYIFDVSNLMFFGQHLKLVKLIVLLNVSKIECETLPKFCQYWYWVD